MIDVDPIVQVLLLSSQAGLEGSVETCSRYIGVWGAKVGGGATIGVQSVPDYWNQWP
jgi:hypothetical protein